MRFMLIVKATKASETGALPSKELLAAMGKFNEEMASAGLMLAAEGLQPSAKGARVKFSGSKRTVVDGPFTETKELIAGFWLIQASSKQEAIEWAKRSPHPFETGESEIEIRQVFEAGTSRPSSSLRKTPRASRSSARSCRRRRRGSSGDPEAIAVASGLFRPLRRLAVTRVLVLRAALAAAPTSTSPDLTV